MFFVEPKAYFSTSSSRSLEAGTWLWFSTPLFPAPILNRWTPTGCASSRPTSVCPFNRAGQEGGEHPNSGVGSVLQPSSRGLEVRALPVHAPFLKPRVSPPLPPALGGGAGPQSEECKLGGPTLGAHSKRDPRARRQVCATRRSAKAGSRGGQPHQISTSSPLGADWLEGNPRGW